MKYVEPREVDCIYWLGLKFADLDVPHWLPYLSEGDLGGERKLSLELPEAISPLNRTLDDRTKKEVA